MGGEKDKNRRVKPSNIQCWGESKYLVWVLAAGHWGVSTSIYKLTAVCPIFSRTSQQCSKQDSTWRRSTVTFSAVFCPTRNSSRNPPGTLTQQMRLLSHSWSPKAPHLDYFRPVETSWWCLPQAKRCLPLLHAKQGPRVPQIIQMKGSLTWTGVMSSCLGRKQAAACLWCKTDLLPRFKAKVWLSFKSHHRGTPHQWGFPHSAGLDYLQSPFFHI